jgi:hypothetical protein
LLWPGRACNGAIAAAASRHCQQVSSTASTANGTGRHGGHSGHKRLQAVNMNLTANIPVAGPELAIELFFICSRR